MASALGSVPACLDSRVETYQQQRWQRSEAFSAWLDQSALPGLTDEQAPVLYRASGGGKTGEFKTNPIEEVTDSLDFLLFDTIMLEGRFDECASHEGAYNLAGTGKEFYSYLLCHSGPALFTVRNSHAERAWRQMETLQPVRQQLGLAHFRSVDDCAYALSRPAKGAGG